MCLDLQGQAESCGQAAACSSGAVAQAQAAQAGDAVQVRCVLNTKTRLLPLQLQPLMLKEAGCATLSTKQQN